MKKISTPLLFICMLLSAVSAFSQAPTDVFISEYVEGSSNNKAIELYNGTGNSINLSSGNYVIQMYFNGGLTASTTITLTGTVAPGAVFVLANGSASFAGATYVNQTNTSSWYNGDDAIVLRKGGAAGTIVDVIGQVGFDPGTEWGTGVTSTADNSIRRKAAICTGDINSSDVFDPSVQWTGFATDDFSGLGAHTSACGSSPITLNTPSLNFSTVAGTPSAEQSYTVKGDALTTDITISVPPLSNFLIAATAGGPYSGTITIAAAAANAAPVPVYVIFSPSTAGTQTGNITHTSGASTVNLAVQGSATGAGGITRIYEIQGSGAVSPFNGTVVTTEGLVTADFQGTNQLGGFFIQDTSGDGNSLTSDGILIFNTSFPVNVGDYVRLTGAVTEFFEKTEINNVTAFSILSSGNTLMSPVTLTLPVAALTDLEAYEGMLVRFPQTLTVTETFTLGRFGEVSLSANGRVFNPTNFIDPNDNPAAGTNSTGISNVAAVTAQQSLNDRSRILLDDASTVQNPAIIPYLNPADTTLRIGSTLTALTGILDYDFSVYRLQPTASPLFNYAPRPAVPSVGAANVRVASFNVLNYFNGNGAGGGFPTSRGADSLSEFNRQRTKIIKALSTLNADASGLIEIENDGNGAQSAIADLVNGLNAAVGANTYAFIPDPVAPNGNTGTDEIKLAIIYKPAVLTPAGPSKADISAVHNRPPLAQTFTVNATGKKFTLIVNHFKSKSCSAASGANLDQLDGQGCYNASRKLQAQALLAFIDSLQTRSGDSAIISVGDYNAYEEEDPMDILKAGGLVNITAGNYSYVFDGQSGALDHALVTASLNANVSGATKWHINADEPVAKSYDQQFNPAYAYSPDAFRSSDHDPILAGLRLGNIAPSVSITSPVSPATYSAGATIAIQISAADIDGGVAKVDLFANGVLFATDSTAPYTVTGTNVEAGIYNVVAKATDSAGAVASSDTLKITVTACTPVGSITGEGYTNIPGTQVADLTANAAYPNNPSINALLNTFEYANVGNNYGARVRGYICAPATGNYTFYVAGDEQAGLWLSTDENPANKILIAYNETTVGFRQYYIFPTQKSVTIPLVKGARYYIETLHKQGPGGDHLSVAWVLPNGTLEAPIAGNRLSPVSAPAGARVAQDFSAAMQNANLNLAAFKVTATPNPSANYFSITTRSSNDKMLTVTLTDVLGRVLEKRMNIAANGTLQLGNNLRSGIYFVEVTQGSQKQKLRLVKQ